MGLKMLNSGVTLVRYLQTVLADLSSVESYMDVLIHSHNWTNHMTTVIEVLRLANANLTVRPSKSITGTEKFELLGQELS